MLRRLLKKLQTINPWHFLWIIILLSEALTLILNSLQSLMRWGYISRELIEVGVFDAFIVSLIAAPGVIYSLNSYNKKLEQDLIERRMAEEEKDRLLKAVSVVNEGIAITDEQDRFIYVNDTHAKIYGYPKSELIGKTWRDVTPEQFVRFVEEAIDRTLHIRDIGIWDGESLGLRKDGTLMPTKVTATARWNEQGEYLGHICIVKDITERKRAEERIRHQSQIIEQSSYPIVSTDLEGYITNWNRGAELQFGYTPEEVAGKHISVIYPAEEYTVLQEQVIRPLKEKGRHETEVRLRGKTGKEIQAILSLWLLRDYMGNATGMVGYTLDITDRKQMVDKLKQSEEKYRSMVETTDDSIYIVDKDCKYIYMNRKGQRRLGISDDAYVGRSYGDYHTSEQTQWFADKIQRAFLADEAYQYERMSTRDGKHYLLTLSPIRSGSGEIYAVSTISKDITEVKQMQDKLRILSITDDLTGLYNRRGFFSLAEHQLKIASRKMKGLFLLYADINNLKQVNDKFGHLEGDQLIIKTADILKDSFRSSDIIARIGGDEFVIFPVEVEDGTPDGVLHRLQNKIDRINDESIQRYTISVSIGKAYFDPSKPCSIEELLHLADTSMYEDKMKKNRPK